MSTVVSVTFAIYHAKLGPSLQTTSEASPIFPIPTLMSPSTTEYKSIVIEATVVLLSIQSLPLVMLSLQVQPCSHLPLPWLPHLIPPPRRRTLPTNIIYPFPFPLLPQMALCCPTIHRPPQLLECTLSLLGYQPSSLLLN